MPAVEQQVDPTTDQIRILRDLYYNCGVRSPSAEQIQRISARLRQFGKIEGKNVFYWFQNHKARERQKKRLTVDVTSNKYNSPSSQQRGEGGAAPPPHIETLPLFPVRSEEDILGSGYIPIRAHFSAAYLDQPQSEEEEDRRHYRVYGGDGASLELSLYSFDPLPTTSS
ncbi:unnamed protein product [Spirodela intermedia]|uniref:Homeobox domain-containing protein n=1 Tax=Spirodela intermedia TaxID=51605 RepID=A0A7I8IE53_SPIIN|nr:unnamed protein product [Spirodela intermedia]CAA6655949.1 unnamed protein product [Spirodela intermedia]